MGIFSFFKSTKEDQSARVAKERLQVLIAHERSGQGGPDYLPKLRQDILEVIKKYVAVSDDALTFQIESQDNCDVLEMNITLPDDSDDEDTSAAARRRAEQTQEASAT